MSIVLDVEDLSVEMHVAGGTIRPVDGVSFTVREGETLAVLGESGCGKSVTAQAVMGILDAGTARVSSGAVRYEGRDLLTMPESQRRRLRGPGIAMVFQDALVSLNPVYSVGWQIAEPLRVHTDLSQPDVRGRVIELMDRMGIPDAARRRGDYPHQFSGGMRQRIMIAMAVAAQPRVLIADEPTTALDVTVQAQIMELLRELLTETGMSLVLITHDLALASEEADRVAVMYAGRVVETGPAREVFAAPSHPYTQGLLGSVPPRDRGGTLRPIPGTPPSPQQLPTGCPFHPRCPLAQDICRDERPELLPAGDDRASACHFADRVSYA